MEYKKAGNVIYAFGEPKEGVIHIEPSPIEEVTPNLETITGISQRYMYETDKKLIEGSLKTKLIVALGVSAIYCYITPLSFINNLLDKRK
jgi:hypothetical protein